MNNEIIPGCPKYTSQRDNYNLDGTHNWSNQCMIEECSLFNTWWFKEFLGESYGQNDFSYLATVTANLKAGETRYDWLPNIRTINKMLKGNGITDKELQRRPLISSRQAVQESLKKGWPVIASFNIFKFLPDELKPKKGNTAGHIELIVGKAPDGLIVLDSFGNAKTKYKDHNGDRVNYTEDMLTDMITNDRQCAILTEIKEK